jgi:uncharacterized membrane protein YuzA (DUF378 family)
MNDPELISAIADVFAQIEVTDVILAFVGIAAVVAFMYFGRFITQELGRYFGRR